MILAKLRNCLANISCINAQNLDIISTQIYTTSNRINSTYGHVKVIYRKIHSCFSVNVVTPFWVWHHNSFDCIAWPQKSCNALYNVCFATQPVRDFGSRLQDNFGDKTESIHVAIGFNQDGTMYCGIRGTQRLPDTSDNSELRAFLMAIAFVIQCNICKLRQSEFLNAGHYTRNGRSSRGKLTAHNLYKSCHFDLLSVVFAPISLCLVYTHET